MDYVLSIPAANFFALLNSASKDATATAREHFRNVEPFEAFRVVIADAIWQRRNRFLSFENVVATNLSEPIQGNFSDNRARPVTSEWRYENGDFFMVNFGGLPIRQRSSAYNPNRDFFVRVTTPRHEFKLPGFELGFTNFDSRYFGFVHTLGFNLINKPEIGYDPPVSDLLFQEGGKGVTVEGRPYNPFVQLPISVGDYFVIPYLVGDFGIGMGTIIHAFAGGTVGARFAWPTGNRNRKLYLGLEYSMRWQGSVVGFKIESENELGQPTNIDFPIPGNPLRTFGVRFGFEY
jgi:hypothetical protein